MSNVKNSPEIWKPIHNFEGWYEASNAGFIKRLKRGKGSRGEHILKAHLDRNGYLQVELHKNGIGYHLHMSRLVAGAFLGQCPDKLEVNHINGIKTDNRVENLEYVTRSQNQKHAYANRLHVAKQGDEHWKSKLTLPDVAEIRRLLKDSNLTMIEIATLYGVDDAVISQINTGRSWRQSADNTDTPIRTGNNRNARLTPEQINEIRRLLDIGISQTAIAKQFGVGQTAISKIKSGTRWKT